METVCGSSVEPSAEFCRTRKAQLALFGFLLGGPSAARGCAAWRDVPKRTSNPLARLLSSAASAGEDSPPPELLEGSEADRVVLAPLLSSPSGFALPPWSCDVRGRLESAPFSRAARRPRRRLRCADAGRQLGDFLLRGPRLGLLERVCFPFPPVPGQAAALGFLENDAPRVIHDDRFLEVVDLPVEIVVRMRGSSRWRIRKKFGRRLCARGA